MQRSPLAVLALAAIFAAGSALADIAVPSQADWSGARQSVTVANGETLSYVTFGNEDGPPLILLHGYTDNSRSWSLIAPYFKDRHVYAIDLRGHGGSAAPVCCYGLDSLASDVLGFMDEMKIEKADIVGHSMGSMTAGVFAGLHPERVNHLVLISTGLSLPKASGDWLWANVPTLPDKIDPNSQFMTDWYYNPNPVPADYIDREKAESAATPKHVWMGVLQGLTLANWTPFAERIQAPTLIFWGDQDSLFDAASQEAVKAALPKAKYETVAGFGHNMFWETPETVAKEINSFLAQ